jgi:hypothetical protein
MQKVTLRPDPAFIGVFANQPLTGDSLETQSVPTDSVLRDRPAVDRPSSHANKNEHGSHRHASTGRELRLQGITRPSPASP